MYISWLGLYLSPVDLSVCFYSAEAFLFKALVVSFVSAQSRLRLGAALLVSFLMSGAYWNLLFADLYPGQANCIAGFLMLFWWKMVDDLYMNAVSFSSTSFLERYSEASFSSFNLSGIRTKYPAEKGLKEPSSNRLRFLLGQLFRVCLSGLFLDFSCAQPPPPPETISEPKQYLIRNLSIQEPEDLAMRVAITIGFGINAYSALVCVYHATALVFVGIGLSHPQAWPPFFGSPLEAYTLRRFWGYVTGIKLLTERIFWHQSLRRLLVNTSRAAGRVLGFTSRSQFARAFWLVFCFTLSGTLHTVTDLAMGIPLRESGALQFFVAQSAGIIVEESVQGAVSKAGLEFSGPLRRLLGRVWVLTWFVWVAPALSYPATRAAARGGTAFLPFSPIKLLSESSLAGIGTHKLS